MMHVGSFNDPTPGSGGPEKFTNAVAKLVHLAALGINAAEFLPVTWLSGYKKLGAGASQPPETKPSREEHQAFT